MNVPINFLDVNLIDVATFYRMNETLDLLVTQEEKSGGFVLWELQEKLNVHAIYFFSHAKRLLLSKYQYVMVHCSVTIISSVLRWACTTKQPSIYNRGVCQK